VILSPWIGLTVGTLVVAGYISGPIYPLIISIGGDMYPHRLSRLSGGMTMAATIGVLLCPPLIGFLADEHGIRSGLLGAAILGIPAAVAIAMSTRSSRLQVAAG
jgi:MFS family permease